MGQPVLIFKAQTTTIFKKGIGGQSDDVTIIGEFKQPGVK